MVFFRSWDALTMPQMPDQLDHAGLMKQRQARFANRFGLTFLAISAIAFFVLALVGQFFLIAAPLVGIGVFGLAVVCNRLGLVTVAGCFCILGVIGGISLPLLLQTPLTPEELPLLALFSVSEVAAGLLLPPAMIFATAILNGVLVVCILSFLPLTPDLAAYVHVNPTGALFPSLALMFEVGLITYMVVQSLLKEVKRADRAEEVARLQSQIASDRQQLREAVDLIASVHAQVSRGDLSARVLPGTGNILWEIAVPLNQLLIKAQAWEKEAQRTQEVEKALSEALRYIRGTGLPLPPLTGTATHDVLLTLDTPHRQNGAMRTSPDECTH